MDIKKLEWELAQCQFRNGLGGTALDAMAYLLLGEALEDHPDLCDPAKYAELDMENGRPDGIRLTFMTRYIASGGQDYMFHSIQNTLDRVRDAVRSILVHRKILAGSLKALFVMNDETDELNLYITYITVELETTDGTDKK